MENSRYKHHNIMMVNQMKTQVVSVFNSAEIDELRA